MQPRNLTGSTYLILRVLAFLSLWNFAQILYRGSIDAVDFLTAIPLAFLLIVAMDVTGRRVQASSDTRTTLFLVGIATAIALAAVAFLALR